MKHVHALTPRTRAAAALVVVCVLLLPSIAVAVTRSTVISRGEVWVKAFVPYSQSRYARVDGTLVPLTAENPSRLGYRTDCSGFVSMCLGLTRSDGTPLSLDTATLSTRLTKLASKSELRPGDIILRPKNLLIDGKQVPYGHAVVFVRWVDESKTRYVGYDESGSRDGAVAREIGYPFFGEAGFAPYRYNKIEDSRLRRSLTWYAPLDGTAEGTSSSLAPATTTPASFTATP